MQYCSIFWSCTRHTDTRVPSETKIALFNSVGNVLDFFSQRVLTVWNLRLIVYLQNAGAVFTLYVSANGSAESSQYVMQKLCIICTIKLGEIIFLYIQSFLKAVALQFPLFFLTVSIKPWPNLYPLTCDLYQFMFIFFT